MNNNFKKIIIPFVLMLIFNLGTYFLTYGKNFGAGLSPHLGILFISGLIFGPYGIIGSVIGNLICNVIRGYGLNLTIISTIINFGISYFVYKLWYEKYNGRPEVSRPKLNNTSNVLLFLAMILVCAALFSITQGKLTYLLYPRTRPITSIIEIRYFLNYIISSFIFGIIGIWISNKFDFVHIPKISKRKYNKKLYKILRILLIVTLIVTFIIDYFFDLNYYFVTIELAIILAILFIYITKPITNNIVKENYKSISEDMMTIFLIATIFIIILGIIMSSDHTLITAMDKMLPLDRSEVIISMMVVTDLLLLTFLIPSLVVLKYIEIKVIEPILSFAKIEDFIHENEKIESEGLVDIYSKYINQKTEIGTLANSYTELINFNNNYIENIHKIEGEKERIKAELDIATKIQAANLPTEAIVTNDYTIDGYSKPAKEVGGDFFDYYELDEEHIALIIGDASGKGVPAAILAMICQVMIKQILKHNQDPSRILYLLNNQICENNSESMFITLWLGIYNTTTKELIFSNGGHNPPLIKENNEFKYLDVNAGIVLGIMEDFEFETEEKILSDEIVLYTDGITDANNLKDEMYGEDRLLNFFNEFKSKNNPINPLLDDINNFTGDAMQFDDMTLLYLKIKND